MASIQNKNDICNLANSMLGNRATIHDIENPRDVKEGVFALWYDPCRQYVLKKMMPNFALNRVVVSQKTVPAGYVDQYAFAYEYPVRCLKLLGIGGVSVDDEKPTIEAGLIFTNTDFTGACPIRFIDDVEDVSSFSVEFIFNLAAEIAKRVALAITQDSTKKGNAAKDAQVEEGNSSALNAQENKPVRKSVSRFRAARLGRVSTGTEKR